MCATALNATERMQKFSQHGHCYAKFSAHAQVQPSTHRRNDLIIRFRRSVDLHEAPVQYPVIKLNNNRMLDLQILYSIHGIDFESWKISIFHVQFSLSILEDHPPFVCFHFGEVKSPRRN